MRYLTEDKNRHIGLDEIAKKLDIVKFMEARHDEAEPGGKKEPSTTEKVAVGPLLISPRHAMDLTANDQPY